MTATATTATDIATALGIEEMPLSDLRKLVSDLDIARSWAAGDIEFGRRQHVVTGPVGKIGSSLVLEDGWEWTGPKTKLHKPFRDIIAEGPPKVEKCKVYRSFPDPYFPMGDPVLRPVEIPEAEALAALGLRVKLTDEGLTRSGN